MKQQRLLLHIELPGGPRQRGKLAVTQLKNLRSGLERKVTSSAVGES